MLPNWLTNNDVQNNMQRFHSWILLCVWNHLLRRSSVVTGRFSCQFHGFLSFKIIGSEYIWISKLQIPLSITNQSVLGKHGFSCASRIHFFSEMRKLLNCSSVERTRLPTSSPHEARSWRVRWICERTNYSLETCCKGCILSSDVPLVPHRHVFWRLHGYKLFHWYAGWPLCFRKLFPRRREMSTSILSEDQECQKQKLISGDFVVWLEHSFWFQHQPTLMTTGTSKN